jgi:RNA polymerase sigma-70 factor (ECF subfamily)
MQPNPTQQAYQETRPYLFAVAYRMTGSASEAEDLVHEAWLRYIDAGSPGVDSLRAYLTTIVSRLSLDYLKSARVRREAYVGPWMPEPVLTNEVLVSPAESAEEREEVSIAFLTLLERLTPDQRVVYVLREAFDLPYDEIATHIGKSAATCRQIHRRANLRLTDDHEPATAPMEAASPALIERFLAAIASGDAVAVASILTDDVSWGSDGGESRLAARRHITGVDQVSRGLAGLMRKIASEWKISYEIHDVNGSLALVALLDGAVERITWVDSTGDKVSRVTSLLAPEKLVRFAASIGKPVATIHDPRAKPRAARS